MAVSLVNSAGQYDSDEASEYSDEAQRPAPVLQTKPTRKHPARRTTDLARLDVISQPPDRVFINLYNDYRDILEPARADRIRRKLEMFKTMTLEQMEQLLADRKQQASIKAKAKQRQRPQHFGSYSEFKLDELYEQIADTVIKRIKQNQTPERQIISPDFKKLLDFAAYNINPEQGADVQKRVAFEVATFVEHILLEIDKE